MVRGISKFRQYFSNYKDQYVLIGGSTEINVDMMGHRSFIALISRKTQSFPQWLNYFPKRIFRIKE